MQKLNCETRYSASDIMNFLQCEHFTTLEIINLNSRLSKTEDDEYAKLIQAAGHDHEARFVETLKSTHGSFVDISEGSDTLDEKISRPPPGYARWCRNYLSGKASIVCSMQAESWVTG